MWFRRRGARAHCGQYKGWSTAVKTRLRAEWPGERGPSRSILRKKVAKVLNVTVSLSDWKGKQVAQMHGPSYSPSQYLGDVFRSSRLDA